MADLHCVTTAARDRKCEWLRAASIPPWAVGVSVVIPNFNTGRVVTGAIRSALQQTYSAIEVLVVDDGSTDDSLDRILDITDDRLTCVRQPNGGLSAARNTGIRLARGRYIAFLDSDDLWSPAKLARHLAVMEEDPSIGVTFCHSAYLAESGAPTGELVPRSEQSDSGHVIKRNHIGNGSTAVVRRECFQHAGLFDEALHSGEDWELWVRVAALSRLSFRLIPEVLTGYRVRPGSLNVTSRAHDSFPATGRRRATLTDIRTWALLGFHLAALLLPKRIQRRLSPISTALLIRVMWRSIVAEHDFAR
jgi:glycosyltransferase involved in cell wall biosynthesis